MFSILLAIQILVSISLIVLVMLQHGKGADMGAAFGSGSSGTVFGARGSGSFFTRATAILAAIFFVNCLLIASPLIRDNQAADDSIADRLEQQVTEQQEAAGTETPAEAPPLADIPAAPEVTTEAPAIQEDVPGDLPATPDSSVADDLPQ